MKDLITYVHPFEFLPKITFGDSMVLCGSCFAEHMGDKLLRYKYQALSNPFGILFNPVSIASSFERIVLKKFYTGDELVRHDGLYHSMDHHGSFSGTDQQEVLTSMNDALEKFHLHFSQTKFFFISLGSAKVYRDKKTGKIAGNCHKIPQDAFESYRLSSGECEEALEKITHYIKFISPEAYIIWTVSPVRHIKDGMQENQLSKSTMLLAIDQHRKDKTHESYFPAYEIMMDQLRDYRFYARDLTHPSPVAIDIIWEMFVNTYLERHYSDIHQQIEKVHRAMEHRFIRDDKESIITFAKKQLVQIEHMASLYPDLDWKKERQYFFQLTEPD